jgi:hypothetical protein
MTAKRRRRDNHEQHRLGYLVCGTLFPRCCALFPGAVHYFRTNTAIFSLGADPDPAKNIYWRIHYYSTKL